MPEDQLDKFQVRFFETFGYLHLRGLLADRIDELTVAFEDIWSRYGSGHNGHAHDGVRRSVLVRFLDKHPALRCLIDESPIEAIASQLLGDDFNYMGSDGNFFAGDTNWHSDGWDSEILHIKFLIYLDPLVRADGALRVLPGSHRVGDVYGESLDCLGFVDEHFKANTRTMETLGLSGADIPGFAVESMPGDVVILNHNCKHASFGGGGRRRMFTVNCCQRFPDSKLAYLREYLSTYARFWIERAYSDELMEAATARMMRHLEQVRANDEVLIELSRKRSLEMLEPSRD